jgi:hypothetical protein
MEIVFLLPTVFVLVLIAVYHRLQKQDERNVEWDRNKDKYKYKGYRY